MVALAPGVLLTAFISPCLSWDMTRECWLQTSEPTIQPSVDLSGLASRGRDCVSGWKPGTGAVFLRTLMSYFRPLAAFSSMPLSILTYKRRMLSASTGSMEALFLPKPWHESTNHWYGDCQTSGLSAVGAITLVLAKGITSIAATVPN